MREKRLETCFGRAMKMINIMMFSPHFIARVGPILWAIWRRGTRSYSPSLSPVHWISHWGGWGVCPHKLPWCRTRYLCIQKKWIERHIDTQIERERDLDCILCLLSLTAFDCSQAISRSLCTLAHPKVSFCPTKMMNSSWTIPRSCWASASTIYWKCVWKRVVAFAGVAYYSFACSAHIAPLCGKISSVRGLPPKFNKNVCCKYQFYDDKEPSVTAKVGVAGCRVEGFALSPISWCLPRISFLYLHAHSRTLIHHLYSFLYISFSLRFQTLQILGSLMSAILLSTLWQKSSLNTSRGTREKEGMCVWEREREREGERRREISYTNVNDMISSR